SKPAVITYWPHVRRFRRWSASRFWWAQSCARHFREPKSHGRRNENARDGAGRPIVRVLHSDRAQPGEEFLLFVSSALEAAAPRHVRDLRLHALLRRFERRPRRKSRFDRKVAWRARRSARRPLQRAPRMAGFSPYGAPFRHPARIFPR